MPLQPRAARMPPRFASAIASVNPVQGGLSGPALALRAMRMTALLAAVMLPAFGVLYHLDDPTVADPMALRWGLAALFATGAAGTYVSAWMRRHAAVLHEVHVYLMTLYFGGLVYANGLSPNYATGYLFVFVVLALSHSIAYTERRPFVRYLLASIATALAVVAATPAPGVSTPIFVLCVGGAAFVLYVSAAARMATHESLVESREQLAAAETLAGTGTWTHDIAEGCRTWSDGLYRLAGLTPTSEPAPSLLTILHPDDAKRVRDERTALFATGERMQSEFRILSAQGDVRHVRCVVDLLADRAGRPVRTRGVVVDVSANVHREEALRLARDSAEDGARAKSAFLSNMSHEIRTPLTAIIGFAQLLGEEIGEAHRDLVDPIETGGLRLLDTLNSVLDLARMEAGERRADLRPVDAGAEAHAVVMMLGASAAHKGLDLSAEVAAGTPCAVADRAALSRVLANLVSNAVKFTLAGSVTVRVQGADGGVEIAVTDTGSGMDAAFLASLYEPFQQASTGWARSHEGTGLGLAITRRLVEDMGGAIAVESAVGQGTTFTVRLPAAEPPVEAPLSACARHAA